MPPIHRHTLWYDDHGNVVQVAVAALAPDWECIAEFTLEVGPFDTVEHVLAACAVLAYDAYRCTGQQMTVWEELEAP